MRTLMVSRTSLVVAALAFAPAEALSQGVTLEQLNGKRIELSLLYNAGGSNTKVGAFAVQVRAEGNLQISGNSVSGSMSRTILKDGRAIGSGSGNPAGAIGRPQEAKSGGNYVWVFQAGTLSLLRTYTVGGLKLTISFGGGGGSCSVRAPLMREVGAGATRRDSVFGGEVVLTSMTQISSTCRVSG